MTIADGHHRYETALRYQEERGRNRACESDPAFDYTLVLLFDSATEPLTVLATHRVVRGAPSGGDLLDAAGALFEVERVASRDALIDAFAPAMGSPSEIGIWTGGSGAILRPRYEALDALMPAGASEALRRLDVTVLSVALERLLALPPSAATVEGGRLRYTKDAAEAISMIDTGDGDAAFLLRPTPVEAIEKVAAAGEVMPQKSTYFFPKAITGLVINPHEG
jgi:uncharacterized protein (DUF1015 family)